MVIKKKYPADKINDDLQGFEEVFDLIENDKDKKRSNSERFVNPHELLNFLEKENERLSKLDQFFSDKAPNLLLNPTSQNLCEIQEDNIKKIRNDIWRELKKPSSIFLKNLSHLFDKVYK